MMVYNAQALLILTCCRLLPQPLHTQHAAAVQRSGEDRSPPKLRPWPTSLLGRLAFSCAARSLHTAHARLLLLLQVQKLQEEV